MVYAAIAAGGAGLRMGTELPKQFLELNGKPILIYTLERFVGLTDKVFLGIAKEQKALTEELLKDYGLSEKVVITPGGINRMETIYNILKDIEAKCSVTDNDIVITHDAVRPFVSNRVIEENIEKCRKFGAAGTFVKTVDTVCISESGEYVSAVPDRNMLYNVQTPQTVNFKLLKKALCKHTGDFEKYTDLCGLLCTEEIKAAMVQGDYSNIKITTPSDLKIAEKFVEEN